MKGSTENDNGNEKREQNAKRQRTYRRRKKERGSYVHLFVPTEVARKIKGKPSLLVRRFTELSDVMDRLEQQDKEIRELRSRLEMRKMSLSLRFEKRLIAKRFGESSEKELLEWANDERRRLAELLAEERNDGYSDEVGHAL
jgi:AraC-like DNA-binding protein